MATLTQGQAARLNLKASQSITVTPSSTGRATVSANGPSNLTYEQKTIYAAETFGPYVADTVMNIAAVSGSLEYTDPYTLVPGFVDSAGNQIPIGPALRGGSLLRHGKPWLRQPTTTTGLTAIGSVTLTATTRRGRNCILIESPATTSVQGLYFALPAAQTVSAYQHAVFEVEDASEFNGGNWRIGFFDGAASVFTGNGKQQVMTVGTANGWDGVHTLAPLTTEWSTVGAGAFDSTVMTQCAFRFVRKSGPTGVAKIWLYEIAEGEKNSLPSIIIGADDGAATWYTGGLPLCEKYGFSSYLSFIADDRGTATRMSQAEWADAIARGHHAVVHGCKSGVASLRYYFSSYTGYASPQAAIEADIAYNRDAMVREGLDPSGVGRTVYVLPAGYHQPASSAGDDTIANALAATGMTVARRATNDGSTLGALIAHGGWSGSALYLPIIGHSWSASDEAANVAAVITQMQTEIAAGRNVILMFHQVEAVPDAAEEITAANLELILAAAATLVRAGTARAGKLTDFAQELLSYTSPVHVGQ